MDALSLINLAAQTTALLWARHGREISDDLAKAAGSKASKWSQIIGKKAATSLWDQVNWQVAVGKYNSRLRALYGTTSVLGKPDPISLDGIFTDVYILDQLSASVRHDIENLEQDPTMLDRYHRRINGMSLVTQKASHDDAITNNRLFILGKPGAGKTTFLKYLVCQATEGQIKRTPIFVSIKEWADSKKELVSFISMQFDICGFPHAQPFVLKILDKGAAIVLFDGLDEVTQEDRQRERTIAELRDFTRKYHKIQCVVTCRIAATSYAFDKFRYVELADFTNEQIEIYARKWFSDQPLKLRRFFLELNRVENRNLKELCRVPLLLGLVCLAFDSTMTFPKRRIEIYEEAVEALMKQWDAVRSIERDEAYHGLSLGRKRQMFARLAATTFQAKQYFVPEKQLAKQIVRYLIRLPDSLPEEDIDGVAVLKSIEAQHGIFCERASKIYSFAHLTFQEYFTARYIADDSTGESLRGLVTAPHISDPRWREVILLTASLLDDADEYMRLFRGAIDNLVAGDNEICNFLRSVQTKSDEITPGSARVRAFYCCLAFNSIHRDVYYQGASRRFDINLLRAYLRSDGALTEMIEGDLDHYAAICRTRAVLLDLAAVLDLSLARIIDRTLRDRQMNFHQNFGRILPPSLARKEGINFQVNDALDYELNFLIKGANKLGNSGESLSPEEQMQFDFHLSSIGTFMLLQNWWPSKNRLFEQYVETTNAIASRLGSKRMIKALTSLKEAGPSTDQFASEQLIDSYAADVVDSRMVGRPWSPTKDQCSKLTLYLRASLLFLEALEVAAVSNRAKIKNWLLAISN